MTAPCKRCEAAEAYGRASGDVTEATMVDLAALAAAAGPHTCQEGA